MQVDYERAWLALKEVVLSKKSHGQRDLSVAMARIEVDSRVDAPGLDPTPTVRRPSVVGPVGSNGHGRSDHTH
jgi:hypothetical protein